MDLPQATWLSHGVAMTCATCPRLSFNPFPSVYTLHSSLPAMIRHVRHVLGCVRPPSSLPKAP
eukprot:scaffold6433_cov125-Cylindrotheca_fusiformis.AAC.12